jgi:DNA-binding MarR family transcriptional regulator
MSTEQPKARTSAGQAFTNLVVETFRFNGRLLAAGDRLTKEFGMTSALWQVLGAIDEQPLTLAQIGRNMGLTRQSVRRSAILLEKKGFITFEENPDHKRAKLVVLTEEGRSVLDRVMDAQITWSNTIADGLDAEDLQAAVRIMMELDRRL